MTKFISNPPPHRECLVANFLHRRHCTFFALVQISSSTFHSFSFYFLEDKHLRQKVLWAYLLYLFYVVWLVQPKAQNWQGAVFGANHKYINNCIKDWITNLNLHNWSFSTVWNKKMFGHFWPGTTVYSVFVSESSRRLEHF